MAEQTEDIGKISAWNEGSLQMIRFHSLQSKINECNSNPTAFNIEDDLYNYQIVFNCLCSLFKESSSKLSKPEIAKGNTIRKIIQISLRKNPVHEVREDQINHDEKVFFHKENWEVVADLLFNYELFVRGLLESHHLTSPEKADPSRAVLEM